MLVSRKVDKSIKKVYDPCLHFFVDVFGQKGIADALMGYQLSLAHLRLDVSYGCVVGII